LLLRARRGMAGLLMAMEVIADAGKA